jgi:hypothetical protein
LFLSSTIARVVLYSIFDVNVIIQIGIQCRGICQIGREFASCFSNFYAWIVELLLEVLSTRQYCDGVREDASRKFACVIKLDAPKSCYKNQGIQVRLGTSRHD